MDLGLSGKVAFVTGAGHGIGKAFSMTDADEGRQTPGSARGPDRAGDAPELGRFVVHHRPDDHRRRRSAVHVDASAPLDGRHIDSRSASPTSR